MLDAFPLSRCGLASSGPVLFDSLWWIEVMACSRAPGLKAGLLADEKDKAFFIMYFQ